MIAKLTGQLDSVGDGWLIVDVGGVGYLVQASSRTLGALPSLGEALQLHIDTQVREDAITLFGFQTTVERDMYRMLTSVQGVGAKVALAILSALSPDEIQTAIAAQDKTAVSRANGVGPKLAARIINELKDKVTAFVLAPSTAAAKPGGAVAAGGKLEDAVSALVNLGYRPMDAHSAVAKAASQMEGDIDLSALITAGLKELSA